MHQLWFETGLGSYSPSRHSAVSFFDHQSLSGVKQRLAVAGHVDRNAS